MADDKNVDNRVDDEYYVAKDDWNFDDLIDDGFSVMTTEVMMTQFMIKSAQRAFIVNVGNIPNTTKVPKKR